MDSISKSTNSIDEGTMFPCSNLVQLDGHRGCKTPELWLVCHFFAATMSVQIQSIAGAMMQIIFLRSKVHRKKRSIEKNSILGEVKLTRFQWLAGGVFLKIR